MDADPRHSYNAHERFMDDSKSNYILYIGNANRYQEDSTPMVSLLCISVDYSGENTPPRVEDRIRGSRARDGNE